MVFLMFFPMFFSVMILTLLFIRQYCWTRHTSLILRYVGSVVCGWLIVSVSASTVHAQQVPATAPTDTSLKAIPRVQIPQPLLTDTPLDSLEEEQRKKRIDFKGDDSLRILLETRNDVARPEPYVTLLVITEGGGLTFYWRTKSGKEKMIGAKLKPEEWKGIRKVLDINKFNSFEPETEVAISVFKQAISVQKGKRRHTVRFAIEPTEVDEDEINKSILEQLGPEGAAHMRLIKAVRAVNARFRWSGQ